MTTPEEQISQTDQARRRRFALGRRLAVVRVGLGLTQAQFADRLGVSKPTYGAWENGQRDLPPLFEALGREFGVDPQTVLFGPSPELATPIDPGRLQEANKAVGQALVITRLRIADTEFWSFVAVAYGLGPGLTTTATLVEKLRDQSSTPAPHPIGDDVRFFHDPTRAQS